jgi:hypothetical protein
MAGASDNREAVANPANVSVELPTACVFAAFLTKLAKHLLVIACLAILSRATGRLAVDQLAIFGLIVVATMAQFVGSALQTRLSKQARLSRREP